MLPHTVPADICCNASNVVNTGVRNPNSGVLTADVLLTKPSSSITPSPLLSSVPISGLLFLPDSHAAGHSAPARI